MPQLHILVCWVTHFLGLEVVPIIVVVGSVLPDAASLDRVFELENLVLQILKLFLVYSDRLCRVVSVQLVLYCDIR